LDKVERDDLDTPDEDNELRHGKVCKDGNELEEEAKEDEDDDEDDEEEEEEEDEDKEEEEEEDVCGDKDLTVLSWRQSMYKVLSSTILHVSPTLTNPISSFLRSSSRYRTNNTG